MFNFHCLIIDHEVKSDLNKIHMKFLTTNHHTNAQINAS